MRLTIFQADKGDCILITGNDGKNILADGGMSGSYTKHVAPFLSKMNDRREVLDLVYVSHIDQDHIAGILKMMDDMVDWKVHKYQRGSGNSNHETPKSLCPPEVKSIWHNSFHEQVGDNSGEIEDMLAANASLLSLSNQKWAEELTEHCSNLVTSMAEGAKLSRRIGSKQLNVPLNQEYGEGLMYVTEPIESIDIGGLAVTVIGPCDTDLNVLRKKWNKWLRSQKGRKAIQKIRREAREDERRLDWNAFDSFIQPILIHAEQLGDRDNVTSPNLASLMLHIEENGKTVLMTGDGHCDDIIWGLEACGKLNDNEGIHVNVLKMQHHGSEHNIDRNFCKCVTADHYIFCGNGAHENPDLRVVREIIESRIGTADRRSSNQKARNSFKVWFNSSSDITKPKYRQHMKNLESMMRSQARRSNGRMKYSFLNRSHFRLSV